MKKIHIPLHKLIGILLLGAIIWFCQSDYLTEVSRAKSWIAELSQYDVLCRMAIFTGAGAALALLSIQSSKVGFRLHIVELLFGLPTLFYGLSLALANYCWRVRIIFHLEELPFPLRLFDFTFTDFFPYTLLISKSDNEYSIYILYLIFLLGGFLTVHGILDAKEDESSANCDKEVTK